MIMLGLAGHAGTGKDSAADYLVANYGFIKFSFSDALYHEVAAAFNLGDDTLLRDRATKDSPQVALALENCTDKEFVAIAEGILRARNALTWMPDAALHAMYPREILQWWGTEYRRKQDPDYWVTAADNWLHKIKAMYQYPETRPQLFVNTSVRFANEREWIHTFPDGNVWHLRREAVAPANSHVSETPLVVLHGKVLHFQDARSRIVFERELFNNSDLEHLGMGVDQLLRTNAKFVRMEPLLPGGQYYSRQADGHNMLCNADGSRSIFDDLDADPETGLTAADKLPMTEYKQTVSVQYSKGH